MNKNNKKGAAESDYLSEAGDVAAETAQKNEGAPPRKKGAAASYDKDMEHERELIYDAKGAIHSEDEAKKAHEGSGRGFTQNFGPARQNSYAKGAAKINEIMGKGAAQTTAVEDVLNWGQKLQDQRVNDNRQKHEDEKASGVLDSVNLVNAGKSYEAKEKYGRDYGKGGIKYDAVVPQTAEQLKAYQTWKASQ